MLILNYTMDEQDKLLSHQVEIVDMIAKKIDHVTVLTGKIGKVSDLGNINLNSYNWNEGKSLANIIKLLFQFYGINRKKNIKVVFSHMTFNQSLVILPFTQIW